MPPKLDAMQFQNRIIKEVLSENREATERICHLANMSNTANTRHQTRAATRSMLAKLYTNMSFFGDNLKKISGFQTLSGQILEKDVLHAWRSFFEPTRALMKLPLGDFVAARMFLYLASAFIYEPAPLYEFCTELDDALLEPLTRIWAASDNCESYDWVFTEYLIEGLSKTGNSAKEKEKWFGFAQVLSLKELTELGGIKGERFYYKDRYDGGGYELYTGPKPRWDCDEDDEDMDGYLWTASGSDGPIRGEIHYRLLRDDGYRHGCRKISVLRRSRQFCFDARQITEATIGKQEHELLNTICLRHGIPSELQLQILSYLEYREPFPYLQKLDIAAAYLPFPTVGERCLSCEGCENDSTLKRTCPQSSLYIWNLALRRFHVFHKNSFRAWALCANIGDCPGHHECDNWAVAKDPEFTLYLDALAAKGNNEFISLDQVGLGPVKQIRLDDWVDSADRWYNLFWRHLAFKDSKDDLVMIGGLGGIRDSMLHGRVLTGAWEGMCPFNNRADDSEAGIETVPAQWALGRNLLAQTGGKRDKGIALVARFMPMVPSKNGSGPYLRTLVGLLKAWPHGADVIDSGYRRRLAMYETMV
ncbi:hypothetical protein FSARC_4592 [Fusarium sarcochroum]|uniref:Uncharacterized protein n=1 Tax=Fusarium sarcochroum TaxID=1208366 RepID=A0A8H4XBD5_9HYPO|nr:hypothetical protein FSARC_4592 [Fusarium sarcochroum]